MSECSKICYPSIYVAASALRAIQRKGFPWPEGTDGCVPVRVVQAVASHLEVANADTSVAEGQSDVTACGHWPPTMAAVWTRFRATNLH